LAGDLLAQRPGRPDRDSSGVLRTEQRLRSARPDRRPRGGAGRSRRARPGARDRPRQRRRLGLGGSDRRDRRRDRAARRVPAVAGAGQSAARAAAALRRPLVLGDQHRRVRVQLRNLRGRVHPDPVHAGGAGVDPAGSGGADHPLDARADVRRTPRRSHRTPRRHAGSHGRRSRAAGGGAPVALDHAVDGCAVRRAGGAVHPRRRRHGPRVRPFCHGPPGHARHDRSRQGLGRQLDGPRDRDRSRHGRHDRDLRGRGRPADPRSVRGRGPACRLHGRCGAVRGHGRGALAAGGALVDRRGACVDSGCRGRSIRRTELVRA